MNRSLRKFVFSSALSAVVSFVVTDSFAQMHGGSHLNKKARWKSVATSGAPGARMNPTIVWDGTKYWVWGGFSAIGTAAGAAAYTYTPNTDVWILAGETGTPPTGRGGQTAVWTGSEIWIFGGANGAGDPLGVGAKLNTSSPAWSTMSPSGAPTNRELHTAVWSGTEMIVWGGGSLTSDLNTGGRYNGSSWTATQTVGAPSARRRHTAVWTGSAMYVWGGSDYSGTPTNTGASYNTAGNTWTAITTTGAPTARYEHVAVWTGADMIIWGGYDGSTSLNTGARFNGSTWTAMAPAPIGLKKAHAYWTGTKMVVIGGVNAGGSSNWAMIYDPTTDHWTKVIPIRAPPPRVDAGFSPNGVGGAFIWGGYDGGTLSTGGMFSP